MWQSLLFLWFWLASPFLPIALLTKAENKNREKSRQKEIQWLTSCHGSDCFCSDCSEAKEYSYRIRDCHIPTHTFNMNLEVVIESKKMQDWGATKLQPTYHIHLDVSSALKILHHLWCYVFYIFLFLFRFWVTTEGRQNRFHICVQRSYSQRHYLPFIQTKSIEIPEISIINNFNALKLIKCSK